MANWPAREMFAAGKTANIRNSAKVRPDRRHSMVMMMCVVMMMVVMMVMMERGFLDRR
jgi:predicted nucleic acid-binding Zn ribbon protein